MQSIHLGIIPDGNRRWCKKNKKNNLEYASMIQNMIENLFAECENKLESNIEITYPNFQMITELSIYILSKDNIQKRNNDTIELIKKVIELIYITMLIPTNQNKIKIDILGDITLLPLIIQEQIQKCITLSRGNFPVHLAIGYDPIEDSKQYLNDGITSRNQIDLVIRTGGQLRSSGFFPLQILYSEWIYMNELFPEITRDHINQCIEQFLKRQRNFGK